MNCLYCNKELIHSGDHSYEDYSLEGEGIVSNLTCADNKCDVETVIVYINTEQIQNNKKCLKKI
jgi:hypothetical protein